MIVELLDSADEFLLRTEDLRAADPFRTNILGSVATAVSNGNLSYDAYFWWVISNNARKVVGAAMRTAPHGMVLSPMPLSAVQELARSVTSHDDGFPGVSGPTLVVDAFVDAYKRSSSRGSLRQSEIEGRHLLYALERLTIPEVAGTMKVAGLADFDFVLQWYLEFAAEAEVLMPNPEGSVRAGLARNALRFWEVGDEIVSLAGHAPLVETPEGTVGRIGPVYTPPKKRRRGYAGALTAALSEELLKRGARIMLYTDAGNPTSNSIYQRIGFELIDENQEVKFHREYV